MDKKFSELGNVQGTRKTKGLFGECENTCINILTEVILK